MTFIELAERFAELTREKRDLQEREKQLNSDLRELESQMLATHEASGIGSSVKLASGGTLVVSEKMGARKLDEDALIAWLDGHEMADFARRSVNTNSLAALVRECVAEGKELPAGVEAVPYKQVTWTKR